MISMHSSQLRQVLSPASLSGQSFDFSGVEIDSRKPCDGRLFVAIRGENFDGHDFVAMARQKGAVAAVVEHAVDVDIPQLTVTDCTAALGKLANAWRRQLNPLVVAITGSNGKTSVKEMLGRILSDYRPTLKTAGNLNNDIGVPLTLSRLDSSHRYAVVEMGANHVDEIRQLVGITEPDVVYVNNARAAHVEGFGSLDKVISAKGEMYRHSKANAIAVFNADEPALQTWRSSAAAERQLTFSMTRAADVRASFENFRDGLQLQIEHAAQQASCRILQHGAHAAQNALGAITLAIACGLSLQQAASALQGFQGVSGRQQFKAGVNDSLIIDDSYNANPDSLAAAVEVLCALPGRHWLALGDMAELGAQAQALHDDAVAHAREKGVEQFFALGEKSCKASAVFGANGHCFAGHPEMAAFIRNHLQRDINLLVKGSRSAHMEKLVNALVDGSASLSPEGERHAV